MVLSGPNEIYLLRDKELFVTNGNGELVVSRPMPWQIECWHEKSESSSGRIFLATGHDHIS